MLLAHGAAVSGIDRAGHTALHRAVTHHDEPDFYLPLVAAGCGLDVMCDYQYSPLIAALSCKKPVAARNLIHLGADIDLKGQHGEPEHRMYVDMCVFQCVDGCD